jgi:hypothetical protein
MTTISTLIALAFWVLFGATLLWGDRAQRADDAESLERHVEAREALRRLRDDR